MKRKLLMIVMSIACLGINAQQPVNSMRKADRRAEASSNLIVQNKIQETSKVATDILESKKALNKSIVRSPEVEKVISSKTLKSGAKYNIYESKDGRVIKTITNPAKQATNRVPLVKKDYTRAESAMAQDYSFFEGFEGWDGTTKNWLPTGWTKFSKTGSLSDAGIDHYNFTWAATDGGYTVASEGNYMVGIQFALPYQDINSTGDTIVVNPVGQDEWLISPVIAPKTNEKLYFDLAYDAAFMLLDEATMQFSNVNQYIEVYVSQDNGATWTKEWEVIEDARSYTDDELWDIAMSWAMPWKTFNISLSKYVGKNIKLAFRFADPEGKGNSAFLDAIKVAVPEPEAFYSCPQGYFFWGVNEDWSKFPIGALLGPAYEDAKWFNLSNSDSETFEWSFQDPTSASSSFIFTDKNPVVNYPYAFVEAPTLVAKATGGVDSQYQWDGVVKTGGTSSYLFQNETEETFFGVGNYNLEMGIMSSAYDTGKYLFGTGSKDVWGPGTETVGISNYFGKPQHKYMFEKLWITCGAFSATPDAELVLTIRRIVGGYLKDTIATSVCNAGDVIKVRSGAFTIPFNFYTIDPETGREEQTYVEVEDAILVTLSGFSDGKVTALDVIFQGESHVTGESNAYIYVSDDNTGEVTLYNTAEWLLPEYGYTSFLFTMDVTYPFMFADNNKYEAPTDGGTHVFEVKSYWNTTVWWFETTVPSWVTVGTPTYNSTTKFFEVPVTVDALPSTEKGREAKIKIASYATDATLNVVQGEVLGINNSKEDKSEFKAVRKNNSFELLYPQDAVSVAVINVSGQKVAEYQLDPTGKYLMPVSDLSNGVYILKFAGSANASLKIVK